MPGPPKTPTDQLAPGGRRQRERQKTEPKPLEGTVEAPADLTDEARTVWDTWTPLLPKGVLTRDTARAFGMACEAYVDWRRCVDFVRENGEGIERESPKGGIYFERYPEATKRLEYERQLYQWMGQFGLTPASRPNVKLPEGTADIPDEATSRFFKTVG